MDHQGYVIFIIIVCALAGLFGLLHLVAAGSQMRKDQKPSHIIMMAGALCTIAAVVVSLFGAGCSFHLNSLLMALGGGAVCGAAWWNGKSGANSSGNADSFHLSHHIIRFGLVLLLVLAFIRI